MLFGKKLLGNLKLNYACGEREVERIEEIGSASPTRAVCP